MSPFQGQPCSCHQSLSSVPCCEHPWRSSQRVSMQLTRRKWLGLCDCRVKMGLTAAFIHKERKTGYASSRVSLARASRPPATNTGVGMAVRGSSLGSPVPHSVMRIYSATPPRAGLAFNWFLGPQGCTPIGHNTLCDILSYNWEFSGRSFLSFQSWALELFPGNLLSCTHAYLKTEFCPCFHCVCLWVCKWNQSPYCWAAVVWKMSVSSLGP